jgi:pimeloyl-ACP methyl ester carboxylesterase
MHLPQQLAIKYIRTKFKLLSAISKRKAAEKAFLLFCTPQQRTSNKIPEVFEQAETLHFSFQDHRITGYRWSHPSDKKVLILHGYESSVTNFHQYVKPLQQSGYEVLAFDAPAHGRSSGKSINVLLYKEFILHINQHYGPITSFIAHSLGGLAVCLALEELPHDDTFKAALIAPATETTTAIDYYFNLLRLDKEVRTEFDRVIEEMGRHKPEWFSANRAAENIRAKVLWLQDTEDQMTPFSDVQPLIEKQYPNFQFLITNGLGHRKIYRDHQSVKAIIDFMSGEGKC